MTGYRRVRTWKYVLNVRIKSASFGFRGLDHSFELFSIVCIEYIDASLESMLYAGEFQRDKK